MGTLSSREVGWRFAAAAILPRPQRDVKEQGSPRASLDRYDADRSATEGLSRWRSGPIGLALILLPESSRRLADQLGGLRPSGPRSIAMARGASAGCSPREGCVRTSWARSSPTLT